MEAKTSKRALWPLAVFLSLLILAPASGCARGKKTAEMKAPAKKEEPESPVARRKRGWFGRLRPLPKASLEKIKRRKVITAKGEVSPPAFEHKGLALVPGETTKARIIATYGEPEHTFFSEGAEELLIYRHIGSFDSLYIFLDSQGKVKDYILTKEP
jgi:hypothetical protein